MANADLSSILDDLAAGRIDTAEAGRRIEAAKRAAEEAEAPSRHDDPAPKAAQGKGGQPSGGLTRVAITAVGAASASRATPPSRPSPWTGRTRCAASAP